MEPTATTGITVVVQQPEDIQPTPNTSILDKRIPFQTIDPSTEKPYDLYLPLDMVWDMYDHIHQIGGERVARIARFGTIFIDGVPSREDTENHNRFLNRLFAVDAVLLEIEHLAGWGIDIPIASASREEHLISFTYGLLRHRILKHAEAAEFASMVLDRPITPEAWRKRIERWAAAHNLPKIEKRTPKTK